MSKSVNNPTFKGIFRYSSSALIEYYNKALEYDKPIYLGATVLKLSVLLMSEVFHNVQKPFLKNLQIHYMVTDSLISFTEGTVADKHIYLSNLEIPNKTINKVPGQFKLEFGSKIIE